MSYGNRELSYQKTQTKQPLNFFGRKTDILVGKSLLCNKISGLSKKKKKKKYAKVFWTNLFGTKTDILVRKSLLRNKISGSSKD